MRSEADLRENKTQLGADLIHTIDFTRWNGSNNAFGLVSEVSIVLLTR